MPSLLEGTTLEKVLRINQQVTLLIFSNGVGISFTDELVVDLSELWIQELLFKLKKEHHKETETRYTRAVLIESLEKVIEDTKNKIKKEEQDEDAKSTS